MKDIEDEIPFEVSEGWAWCRLGSYLDVRDGTHDSPKYVEKGYPFVTSKNLVDGKIDFSSVQYISEKDHNEFIKRSLVEDGDILFAMIGSIGNPVLVKKDREFSIKNVALFKPYSKENTFMEYVLYFLIFIQESLRVQAKGGMQPFIPLSFFRKDLLIPLPPVNQQKIIVAEIKKIFTQINSLETDKIALQTVIKQAKSKILDLAIHGKLVPQNPSDEPASLLLEKLREEKEAKIKAGELKRDKNDSYIYKNTTDNCYYEKFADGTEEQVEPPAIVPESWVWCHFGDVADVINGKNQSKVEDESGIYPIYGSGGIMGRANDYICPENCTIIGRKGSINNPIFVEEKFWNVDTAFGLAPSTGVLPKYLFYFCKSFNFTSLDSSTTLPSLTKTNIQQILFPLPSLSEQQRILNKVESLFKKLDEIVLNLI